MAGGVINEIIRSDGDPYDRGEGGGGWGTIIELSTSAPSSAYQSHGPHEQVWQAELGAEVESP